MLHNKGVISSRLKLFIKRGDFLQLKIFGKGFNYSQDGPGNRLVYHLSGCNMHCPWCSNPEGMKPSGSEPPYPIKDIYNEILSSSPMFFEGGGVTFTGGEATLQPKPLLALLKMLKGANINTCIETNGTSPDLPQLFEFLDHLIIDFKHPDSIKLKRITGIGNETIKQNILAAKNYGIDTLVRIPLIGGFNDDCPLDFAEFLKTANAKNLKVEILKYHEYGKDKWKKLGLDYKMQNAFVTDEQVIRLKEILKSNQMNIIKT